MPKVVVFADGTAGEIIAEYIEAELPVEVIRLIDENNGPYAEKSGMELRELAEVILLPYIGKVDVIILASTTITLFAENHLKETYPNQQFIGYGWKLPVAVNAVKEYTDVMILSTTKLRRTEKYQLLKVQCDNVTLIEPDCGNWPDLIKRNALTEEYIKAQTTTFTSGTILVYATEFLEIEEKLRKVFGWSAAIMDLKGGILIALKEALKLKDNSPKRVECWVG